MRARVGPGEIVLREVLGVDQLDAGRDIEAAGAADHQEALHARGGDPGVDRLRALQEIVVDLRVGPAGVVGGDHGIGALHGGGDGGGVGDVGLDHGETGARRELRRGAGERGDGMAAGEGFVEDGGADIAGGADQSDLHGHISRCPEPAGGLGSGGGYDP